MWFASSGRRRHFNYVMAVRGDVQRYARGRAGRSAVAKERSHGVFVRRMEFGPSIPRGSGRIRGCAGRQRRPLQHPARHARPLSASREPSLFHSVNSPTPRLRNESGFARAPLDGDALGRSGVPHRPRGRERHARNCRRSCRYPIDRRATSAMSQVPIGTCAEAHSVDWVRIRGGAMGGDAWWRR